MNEIFSYNQTIDIPIYQQLVDKIRMGIKNGTLPAGEKLPTVQELSAHLSVARGTVKRIYDELEHEGLIEKTQGRGTFVRPQATLPGNRKEQAMEAIDSLLDRLYDMGFSSTEINIYLSLKLREREELISRVKVAVLECNPENLDHICEQLHDPEHLELFPYLVENILAYPYHLQEDIDLIVTTTEHARDLEPYFSDNQKMARIALRPASTTLSDIIKLPAGTRVGILSYSDRFGQLLLSTCQNRNPALVVSDVRRISTGMDIDGFLSGIDAVLVPKFYKKYCPSGTVQALNRFAQKKPLISCSYKMDEGSSLYLEERIKHALKKKQK